MLSETDPKPGEEPWFALSRNQYQSILDQALSEMEAKEEDAEDVLPPAELTNCTELIKLLTQDDGLDRETGSSSSGGSLVTPGAGVNASGERGGTATGQSVQNNSCKRKEQVLCKPVNVGRSWSAGSPFSSDSEKRKRGECNGKVLGSPCKSSRGDFHGPRTQPRCTDGKTVGTYSSSGGRTQGRTEVNRTDCSRRIQNHSEISRRNVEFRGSRTALPVSPRGFQNSRRTPQTFSLNFHDVGRRPSTSADEGYSQGRRSIGHSLQDNSIVIGSMSIPSLDLNQPKFFQNVEAKQELWPCSNSFPCTFLSVGNVKVELEDEVSGGTLEKTVLRDDSEVDDSRRCIPPKTFPSRSDWNDSFPEVTSYLPASGVGVDVMPFLEALNPVASGLPTVNCISRRINLDAQETQKTRVIPYRLKSTVKNDPESSLSTRFNGRMNARYPSKTSPGMTRDVRRSGSGSEAALVGPPDGERTAAVSSSQMRFGGSQSGKKIPSGGERELWAAVDKSMVISMMEQILDEEMTSFQPQLDDDEDGGSDHPCPTGLVTDVDPIKPTERSRLFPLGSIVLDEDLVARNPGFQVEQRSERERDDVQHGGDIEVAKPHSNQDRAYDLRIKPDTRDGFSNMLTSNPDTGNSVHRPSDDQLDQRFQSGIRRMQTASLVGETALEDKTQIEDAVRFNRQKIGLSGISFKWKSDILHRLRNDQMTANKWRLSETLSA